MKKQFTLLAFVLGTAFSVNAVVIEDLDTGEIYEAPSVSAPMGNYGRGQTAGNSGAWGWAGEQAQGGADFVGAMGTEVYNAGTDIIRDTYNEEKEAMKKQARGAVRAFIKEDIPWAINYLLGRDTRPVNEEEFNLYLDDRDIIPDTMDFYNQPSGPAGYYNDGYDGYGAQMYDDGYGDESGYEEEAYY